MNELLYKRENYLSKLRGFYNSIDLIKVISGVRRCGKSSLMKLIYNELIENGVKKENITFINLDKRPYKDIQTSDKLEEIIDSIFERINGIKYLFIDEIQNIKNFEILINAYREEGDYSIFITGSNSYLLSGELATKLTGRYIEIEMTTLTFDEYIGLKKLYKKEIDSNLDLEFKKYIIEGGFPLAVRYDSYEDKYLYIKNLIDEIYKKDIKKNKKIKNKELFEKVKTYVINNFGAKMSIGSLSDYLSKLEGKKIRKETIYSYIKILENAKIISKCQRFDIKSKRSLNGEEKYYLSDLSFYFANNVDARINYGPVLENIVYNYFKSNGYEISIGKIGDLEIDFILRKKAYDYFYIQVCRTIDNGEYNDLGTPLVEEREYRPLEKIKDNYPKYVLSLDHLLQKRNGIIHLNLVDLLINKNNLF